MKEQREQKPPASEDFQEQVDVPCPHCGGITSWKLLQTLNRCEYCDSVLYWPYPQDEPEYFVAESGIHSTEDLIDILATYDAMRQASLQRGQFKSSNDYDRFVDLGSGFSDTEAYRIKEQRKHLFRIQESHSLHVPYLLVSTTIVFHVLGRVNKGSRKVFQSLFFTSEDILPAYAPPWDFRDKGLQLSKQRLRLFSPEMQTNSHFLAPARISVAKEDLVRQWRMQRKLIAGEIDPICFDASAVDLRRWLVFRPYYYVQAQTPEGLKWFILDGQFGTIAGNPKTPEVEAVRRRNWHKLDVGKIHPLQVHVIPFRCLNCGWDVELNPRSNYQICKNCTRILEIGKEGLHACSYRCISSISWRSASDSKSVWLPYWYCRLKMKQSGKWYEDLSLFMKEFLPQFSSALEEPCDSFYIPAFDSWTIDRYDRWAFAVGTHLSRQGTKPDSGEPLYSSMKKQDSIVQPSVSQDLIPGLFPRILPLFLPSSVQFRLSTMIINRLAQTEVKVMDLSLVYVPVPLSEARQGEARLTGPTDTIEWLPLKTGQYPPALHRSVRRWMAMNSKDEKTTLLKENRRLISLS